jgi:hypothetical protein
VCLLYVLRGSGTRGGIGAGIGGRNLSMAAARPGEERRRPPADLAASAMGTSGTYLFFLTL